MSAKDRKCFQIIEYKSYAGSTAILYWFASLLLILVARPIFWLLLTKVIFIIFSLIKSFRRITFN